MVIDKYEHYRRLVNKLRRNPLLFTAPEDHKIHRILRKAIHLKVKYAPPSLDTFGEMLLRLG